MSIFASDPIGQTEEGCQGGVDQKERPQDAQFRFDIGFFQPEKIAMGKFTGDDKLGGPQHCQKNDMKNACDPMIPARIYLKVTKRETICGMNQ